MPVWLELIVIAEVAYALGMVLGWLAWGTGRGRARRRVRRQREESA